MGRFKNRDTGVVFSVDDSKDSRYDGPAFVDPDAEVGPDYNGMKLTELKAEITRRNADREDDDKVPSDGNKPDLVAALEADDEDRASTED